MTRSAMARRILRILKNWDGSMPEMKTAYEILDACEKAGMMPPDRLAHLPVPCAMEFEWDTENKRSK